MSPKDEVGPARLQENEKIADALLPSIYAGHLMFSSGVPLDRVISEFQSRFTHRQSTGKSEDGRDQRGG